MTIQSELPLQKRLQKQGLELLVTQKGFEFDELFYQYTSGKIGPYYVQCGVLMANANGRAYAKALNLMSNIMSVVELTSKTTAEVITGGESRDWIFSLPIAAAKERAHTMLYKNGRSVGAPLHNKKVIHIADLNHTGSSPRDYWIPAIRNAGGNINIILFFVDRRESGTKVMQDLGLKSYSVVPLDVCAWNYLRDKGVLSASKYGGVREYLEDQEKWARRILKTPEGREKLKSLLNNPRTFEKSMKILTRGYPDLYE